jgi:hypothetical protein
MIEFIGTHRFSAIGSQQRVEAAGNAAKKAQHFSLLYFHL